MKTQKSAKFSRCWSQFVLSMVLITSLLAGCNIFWDTAPNTITEEADILIPHQTPTATNEPRTDLPPAIVEVYPLPNSVISLDQSITIYFNQPMDTSSVEAAISFEPRISGRFIWEENQIVTFVPDQTLNTGSTVTLAVNTSAQAANRKNLPEAINLSYQTVENLQVAQMMPADGTGDVDPESMLFVAFNQPVVELATQSNFEPAFSLFPEVPGSGEWLNTSTYIFKPDPSMAGGTTYQVSVNGSLMSTSGAGFAADGDLQFDFTTTRPRVLNLLPAADERLNLGGPVEIDFNIRMNPESVEEHFNLFRTGGISVPGIFAWDDHFRKMTFTPDLNLARNARYTIRLDAEAESFGGLPIEDTLEVERLTFPLFSIEPVSLPEFQSYYGEFGQFKIQFTNPIDIENYLDKLSIQPDVNMPFIFSSDGNTSIYITGYFSHETLFTLTIDADLQDQWGGRLGEAITYTFSTPPAKPSFSPAAELTSFNLFFVPASTSELVMQATNINTITLEISPISNSDLVTLLHPDNFDYRQIFLPEDLEVSTRNLNLERNVNEVFSLPLSYQGRQLEPGIYFLRLSSQDLVDEGVQNFHKLFLIVSDNNLVMKISPEQAHIWATRIADYAPLGNVPVSIYTTEGGLITRGQTDQEGLFVSDFERLDQPYATFFALIGEPGQHEFGFTISSWGQPYALYEMGINLDTSPVLLDAYLYTDRPIYRPGDTVHFRGAVFSRVNGLPQPPDLDSVEVAIFGDPGMSGLPVSLFAEELALSRFGTVEGTLTLPNDAVPGLYRIEIMNNENFIKVLYFDVATYRKPEIELEIGLMPTDIIAGDRFNIEVQADYYFGMPVSDQSLSWILFCDDAHFDLPGYQVGPISTAWLLPERRFYEPLGPIVTSGAGNTDDLGQYKLTLSPEDLEVDGVSKGSLQEYHLEVTVKDESGFPVSYRESALVHPELFYIGVRPEAYFGSADSPFSFSIKTVDWAKNIVGDLPLDATFSKIEWELVETNISHNPYRYETKTIVIDSANPVTNADGIVRVTFTPPEPGTYQLKVESGGAVSEALVWVSGAGTAVWPNQRQNQITLTADAERYQPGQIALIFIPNPFERGAKALVTVERGEVMETRVLNVDSAGYTFSLPVSTESIPNVYVSVMLFGRGENGLADYRQGMLNLPVIPINKTLNVSLFVDPTQTEPGERISATLKITDSSGNPVQGEFSVAVVDKAVLALVEPNSPPIIDAFYGEQPLSVQTSFSLKPYATRLTLTSLANGLGGGGEMTPLPAIREDFPDTAFWQANVITGVDGTARLDILLPDSLTTWVVDVRGLTDTFLVGQAEVEIVTHKDLMIQPVTPRFLVEGDRVEMAAVVHNNTQLLLNVDISLQGNGFVLDEDVIPIRRMDIEAGESKRVSWWGTVENVDSVELVFRAAAGEFSDASKPVWGDLDVRRYVMPNTFSAVGQLAREGQRLELVSLPISTDPSSGNLLLELTPSLTATLVDGLQALEQRPYQDTVSILSRLMANLNATMALTRLGVESPQLKANLERLADEGVSRLLEAQNIDGGWSWWAGSSTLNPSSNAFITAYVLIGLDQASAAGVNVPAYFIEQGTNYLFNQLPQGDHLQQGTNLDHLVFQVYALHKSGLPLNAYTTQIYEQRSGLSPWALALFGLSLREMEGPSSRVNTLIADLEAAAIRSATGVYWESRQGSWMLPGTPLFNTAVSVYVLSQLDPASTSVLPALQYLMVHRQTDGLWSSTFESAWALMAITMAMQGTGDVLSDFDFLASLNDELVAEGSATGAAPQTTIHVTTPISLLYPDSPNAVMIERGEGVGTLFYRLDLFAYQSAADAEPINRGIYLQRDYYLSGEGCPGGTACRPIESLTLESDGPPQVITVTLTLVLPHDMYHLMVEDFIPAGTEIFQQKFVTSQTLTEDYGPVFDPRAPFMNGWGWWYFNDPQIYDDHVLWTADYLPAGTYLLTYQLLPYQRGVYQVLPAHAWQYFYPEVMGTTAGSIFSLD